MAVFDKFLFGNGRIADLYFGNSPVKALYFGNTLVWEKAQKLLATQNDDVVIEYVPSTNESVSSISCFFNPYDTNSNQIFFKIFHESGLIVATGSYDDGTSAPVTTLYELEGQKRTVTLNPAVTLRAGEKYYIQHTYNNGTAIKPAYFQGIAGNYMQLRNNENKSVADIGSLGTYLGFVSSLKNFLEAADDSFMIWNGNGESLTAGYGYVRSDEACNNYYGSLGSESYGGAEAQQIYFMAVGDIFKWTGQNGAGNQRLHSNYFYRRIYYPMKMYETEVNLNSYNSNMQKLAAIVLGASQKNDAENKAGAKFTGNIWGYAPFFDNIVYTLKDGYSVNFTSVASYETDPGTYVEKRFYYMRHYKDQYNYEEGLFIYINGQLIRMNPDNGSHQEGSYDRIIDYINEVDALNAVEEVGTITKFYDTQFDGNYSSNNFRQASLQTDKKFYLEINGHEV